MKIAVITGASSGMGREFVYALDRDEEFDELWVIARREDRLRELQSKCRAKVRPLALDLQDRASFAAYRALLESEKPEISVLVNALCHNLCCTLWCNHVVGLNDYIAILIADCVARETTCNSLLKALDFLSTLHECLYNHSRNLTSCACTAV